MRVSLECNLVCMEVVDRPSRLVRELVGRAMQLVLWLSIMEEIIIVYPMVILPIVLFVLVIV